ncbi:hypothetical protein BDV93DRAFT_528431 [Ceratobasidium sp. AG-I]|nr:hypothetical protein BDV93DRAFT_528431 [Ceratobasidium sp. AG-I]
MRIASSCRLLPPSRGQHFETIIRTPFQPEVGAFGRITDRRGKYITWESLGASRQIRRTDLDNLTQSGALRLTWCNTSTSDGKRWLSFTLRIPSPNPIPRSETSFSWAYRQDLRAPARSRWMEILAEAHELAERLEIDIDSITFYFRNITKIRLMRPQPASWDELPTTFYYHRPLDSFDPSPAVGFISTSKTPDTDVWHKNLKQQGWKVSYKMTIGTLDMYDDWGLQYERELKRSMETMPGSYLGAHVEDIC